MLRRTLSLLCAALACAGGGAADETAAAKVARELLREAEAAKGGIYFASSQEAFTALAPSAQEETIRLLLGAAETGKLGDRAGVADFAREALLVYADRLGPVRGKFDAALDRYTSGKHAPAESAKRARVAVTLAGDRKQIDRYLEKFLLTPELKAGGDETAAVLKAIAERQDLAGAEALFGRGTAGADELAQSALGALARESAAANLLPVASVVATLKKTAMGDRRLALLLEVLGVQTGEGATRALTEYCLDAVRTAAAKREHGAAVTACLQQLTPRKIQDARFLEPLAKLAEDPPASLWRDTLLRHAASVIGPKAVPMLVKYASRDDALDLVAAGESLKELGHREPKLVARFREELKKEKGLTESAARLADLMAAVVGPPVREELEKLFLEARDTGLTEQRLAEALARIGPAPKAADHWLGLALKRPGDDHERVGAPLAGLYGIGSVKLEKVLAGKAPRSLRDGIVSGLAKMPEVDERILEKYLPDRTRPWGGGITSLVGLLEARRSLVPEGKRAEWDRRLQALLAKRYEGPAADENAACARVCDIARNAGKWLARNGDYSGPIAGMYLEGAWSYAILNLYGTFVSHAAPYCPKDKLDSQEALATWNARRGWYFRLWNYWRSWNETKVMEMFSRKIAPNPAYDEAMAKELEKLEGELDAESLARAKEFLERSKGGMTVPKSLLNPGAFYGKVFQLLWFQQILREEKLREPERKILEADLRALRKSLGRDLERYQDNAVNRWGSGTNTFAYALGALALPDGHRHIEPLLETMQSIRNPLEVPYDPGEGPKIGSQFPTVRGAAGRAVPFYGALALLGRDPRVVDRAETWLRKAQQGFNEQALLLALHSERDLTHDGDDGLAPYYFLPAAGFQTALLARDADRKGIGREEKAEADRKMAVMRGLLLRLSEGKKGEVSAMGPITYPDAKNYTSPLLGLALLPLIEKCDGKAVPRSYGLLNHRLGPPPAASGERSEPRPEGKAHF